MSYFLYGWHHEHVTGELVSLERKQQVRDACPVQRSFCMEEMFACIAFRYPRAPRPATNPESHALRRGVRVPAQAIHSLHANSSFGCREIQIRPYLFLQQLPDFEITKVS
jgi:hypothetical protein